MIPDIVDVPEEERLNRLVEQAIRWNERGRVRAEILERIRTREPVTRAEVKGLRANSWERHLLYQLYDAETLAWALDYHARNTQACFERGSYPLDYDCGDHYDQTLALVLVPLAARKLRNRKGSSD